jgi:hypothetical protein
VSAKEVWIQRAPVWRALMVPCGLFFIALGALAGVWIQQAERGLVFLASMFFIATGWYAAHAIALAVYRSKDRTVLKFDSDGFDEIGILRRRRVHWSDCSNFSLWAMGGSRMIVFDNETASSGVYRRLTRWLCKRNDWLGVPLPEPLDELVQSMNAMRQDFVTHSSRSSNA